MNLIEKLFSLAAMLFAIALVALLVLLPELRRTETLLPLAGVGLLVNVGLMVIVLRDIFLRPFPQPTDKYLWLALVLFCWPAILVYLFRHGFRRRG